MQWIWAHQPPPWYIAQCNTHLIGWGPDRDARLYQAEQRTGWRCPPIPLWRITKQGEGVKWQKGGRDQAGAFLHSSNTVTEKGGHCIWSCFNGLKLGLQWQRGEQWDTVCSLRENNVAVQKYTRFPDLKKRVFLFHSAVITEVEMSGCSSCIVWLARGCKRTYD